MSSNEQLKQNIIISKDGEISIIGKDEDGLVSTLCLTNLMKNKYVRYDHNQDAYPIFTGLCITIELKDFLNIFFKVKYESMENKDGMIERVEIGYQILSTSLDNSIMVRLTSINDYKVKIDQEIFPTDGDIIYFIKQDVKELRAEIWEKTQLEQPLGYELFLNEIVALRIKLKRLKKVEVELRKEKKRNMKNKTVCSLIINILYFNNLMDIHKISIRLLDQ